MWNDLWAQVSDAEICWTIYYKYTEVYRQWEEGNGGGGL